MQSTSHTRMRTRRVVTEDGRYIPRQRPGRGNDERDAIAQSIGLRRY